jgi:peptidoglycan hydrolase-like protein with peptidoglycan-binding domain
LTASKYVSSDDYLVAGDILLNDVHHVATAVTNGIYSGEKAKADETMPLLKKGSKGKAVRFLQLILGGLDDDGSFGQLTKKAVIAKQKELGVNADGEVWNETWNALIPTLPMLKRGSKGRYVKAIQVALGIDADGSFGWGTTSAVTKMQTAKDIEVDGIVGRESWRAIIETL